MKYIVFLLFFLCFAITKAQVGINTTTPNALLDVRSSNQATPSNTDGVLIPKIDVFPAINPTASQQGMMVYLTTATTFSGNPKAIGFYYWDNFSSDWVSVGNNQTSGWSITGNSGINPATNFIGTLDNADVIFKRNNTQAGLIGSSNTSFGITALNPLTTGNTNSAFGIAALFSNTTGVGNSAFGGGSLVFNTTGNNNSAFGAAAMNSNTSGFSNSAFGTSALRYNTTGINNNAFGVQALTSNTSGGFNSAFGDISLQNNTTGGNNAAFGFGALNSNTTGSNNTAFGTSALSSSITVNGLAAFGYNALADNTTGTQNAAFGFTALQNNTTGNLNAAFGSNSLQDNTTGADNTAMGAIALTNNTTGFGNSAVGRSALVFNTTGFGNNAFGRLALASNVSGNNNAAFGSGSLENNTTSFNSAFGVLSLNANTTGLYNAACGFASLFSNTTGNYNSAIGGEALMSNTTGENNVANGYHSLYLNTTGIGNVSCGANSMNANTTGGYNVALGHNALSSNTSGFHSVAIGAGALNSNPNGNNNVAIGSNSDVANGVNYSSAIGPDSYVTQSNSMVLGSIPGVNSGSTTYVGIGTTAPQTILDVTGYNVNPGGATDGNLLVRTRDFQNIDVGGSISLGGMIDNGGNTARNFASIEGRKANAVNNSQSGYLLFKTNSNLTLVERMRITATGDVGIGTATPGGQLELSLNEGRKPGTTTWTIVSDGRLKTIEGTYTKGLNEILQLKPIRYHYKNNGSRKFEQEVLDTEFSGFIAQEVQPLFPDAVQEDEDGFLSFNMHAILVASINAIKELNTKIEVLESKQTEVEQLKKQVEQQQQINADLLSRLAALEAQLAK